ncbi:MAG: hypothetical protein WBO23_08495 [Burkholderiales bacterium]
MGPKSTRGYRLFLLSVFSVALSACSSGGDSDNTTGTGAATTHSGAASGGGTNYTVGGTATGLSGTVVLQNNGGNDLTLSANSAFAFATSAATGSNYSVTVLTQPASQTCAVANSAGTVSGADVTDVSVTCSSPSPSLALFAGDMERNGSDDGVGAAARFFAPEGVATDSVGNVYVADRNNHTIRKITAAGMVSTLAGAAGMPGSSDSTDGTGATASFFLPTGVATDSSDNVYVSDFYTSILRKITPLGVVTTLADATGAMARFALPRGVATDGTGNVYVADWDANAIRKITPASVITSLGDVQFNYPHDIATDSAGNVYVADWGNHTIRKITPAGAVSTVVGVAGQAGFAPGALPGLLNAPIGLTIRGASLYITLRNGVAVVQNLP